MWSPDAKWVECDFHTVQSLAEHPTRAPANSTTANADPKRIGSSVREADGHRDRGTPQNTPRPGPGQTRARPRQDPGSRAMLTPREHSGNIDGRNRGRTPLASRGRIRR